MALTRAMLNGMGLTAEQISAVIEAHTESTDALKAQRDDYKAQVETLKSMEAEYKTLKANADEQTGWREKYEKEHSDFETYKTTETEKATKAAKTSAYKELLKAAGISEKRIDTVLKVADLSSVELDKDGKIKGADKLTDGIKTEWADFIVTTETTGASTNFPPANQNSTVDPSSMSMEDYVKWRQKK